MNLWLVRPNQIALSPRLQTICYCSKKIREIFRHKPRTPSYEINKLVTLVANLTAFSIHGLRTWTSESNCSVSDIANGQSAFSEEPAKYNRKSPRSGYFHIDRQPNAEISNQQVTQAVSEQIYWFVQALLFRSWFYRHYGKITTRGEFTCTNYID